MSIKSVARFATGAALFSPLLALEDTLRYFNVPISEHGLLKNDEGKGIWEIWKESAPKAPTQPAAETKNARQAWEEQYQVVVNASEDRDKGSFDASVKVRKI